MKSRDSSRLCRLKKKQNVGKEQESFIRNGVGFKSPQSLGKAIRRIKTKLPSSPTKTKQVIEGLAKFTGFKLIQLANDQLHPKRHKNSISEEDIERVKEFYYRTDIVYTTPGMREEITVWNNGKKEKLRKYHMTMYLKEAYALFKMSNPEVNIGFTSFTLFRPANVLLLKDQPAYQCKCRTHENFMLKFKVLAGHEYSDKLWKSYLCKFDELSSDCWKGNCDVCSKGKLFFQSVERKDKQKEVYWKEWVKSEKGIYTLLTKSDYLGALEDELESIFTDFQEHVRVKRIQSNAFQRDKNDPDSSILQVDFAMGYNCEWQSEIQSALWSLQTVNLFTAALYTRNEPCKSFLIVTDSPNKYKNYV